MQNFIRKRKPTFALNVILVLSSLCLLSMLAVLIPLSLDSYRRGYTWEEMDWNNDGHTSLAEFVASAKINKYIYRHAGDIDVEYSHHKTAIKSAHNNVINTIKPRSIEAVAWQAFYHEYLSLYGLLIKIAFAMAGIIVLSIIVKFRLKCNSRVLPGQ